MADLSSLNTRSPIQLTVVLVLVLPHKYTFVALLSWNSWRMILVKWSDSLKYVLCWKRNMVILTSASIFGRRKCKSRFLWQKKYLLFQIYYLASFYFTWRKGEVFQVFKCALNMCQLTLESWKKLTCFVTF